MAALGRRMRPLVEGTGIRELKFQIPSSKLQKSGVWSRVFDSLSDLELGTWNFRRRRFEFYSKIVIAPLPPSSENALDKRKVNYDRTWTWFNDSVGRPHRPVLYRDVRRRGLQPPRLVAQPL